MTIKSLIAFATAALLAVAMMPSPAMAETDNNFSALQGVDAQALSVDEMQAVQGMISATNIAELTNSIMRDPTLSADAKTFLLATWAKLATLDGTKYEFLADAFFLFMKKYKYPTMCGLNADFCAQL